MVEIQCYLVLETATFVVLMPGNPYRSISRKIKTSFWVHVGRTYTTSSGRLFAETAACDAVAMAISTTLVEVTAAMDKVD